MCLYRDRVLEYVPPFPRVRLRWLRPGTIASLSVFWFCWFILHLYFLVRTTIFPGSRRDERVPSIWNSYSIRSPCFMLRITGSFITSSIVYFDCFGVGTARSIAGIDKQICSVLCGSANGRHRPSTICERDDGAECSGNMSREKYRDAGPFHAF
jgi:hypothetical protein